MTGMSHKCVTCVLRDCVITCIILSGVSNKELSQNTEYNRDVSHAWEGCPQVMKTGVYQEQPVELDDDENHEEPTPKRVGKQTEKTYNP